MICQTISVLVVCETESDSQAVHMFFFWDVCKEKNKTNLVKVTKEFTVDKYKQEHPKAILFCTICERGRVRLFVEGTKLKPSVGCSLISLQRD